MQIAQIISQRGTCERLQVGAVITINDRIVSTGYNGPAKGNPHCQSEFCNSDIVGCQRAIHAEQNALDNLIPLDIPRTPGQRVDIYVTHQPCINCAGDILDRLSPQRVFYKNNFRDQSGIKFLLQKNIEVYHIDQNGNIKPIQNL